MRKRIQSKENKLNTIRHSISHILATAVLEIFSKAKLGIGPTIKNGFYYDFDFQYAKQTRNRENKRETDAKSTISEADLPEIEKRMRNLIKKDVKFKKEIIPFSEAKKLFKDQPYKLELIKELQKNKKPITIYINIRGSDVPNINKKLRTSDVQKLNAVFIDLCAGPHVKSSKEINPDAFRLLKTAGAYWQGDEKNKMLQRIYGTAWENKKELEEYLYRLEEAEKRDHRKLGEKMELFLFDETAPAMPYWLPKGVIIINELINFWRQEHQKRGYQEIISPLINKKELYVTSGHWEHYLEEMFISKTEDGETYALKAMNCPNAMVVYASRPRSYRDLPLRLGDTDTLHRYERSGTIYGLLRVREFKQDDAHIFATEEQIESEYKSILDVVKKFYSIFNLGYSYRLGTRPENFMGDVKIWNKAEKVLKKILEQSGRQYTVNSGDGAFYGPKIDILIKDSLGRDWQTGTIQLDFQMPERFSLKYTDAKGKEKTPVVIHRVIYGSLERFIGILLEHFAGALPLWLAPVQAEIINVGSAHRAYAKQIYSQLIISNIRTSLSDENLTVSKRIRDAEIQKIPYILVVGDKEVVNKTINIRHCRRGIEGEIKIEKLLEKLQKEIKDKAI